MSSLSFIRITELAIVFRDGLKDVVSGMNSSVSGEISDEKIVEGIQAGDSQSEMLLASKFSSGLVVMLTRRTGNMAQAEDLAQDTLLTVIERLRKRGIDHPEHLTRFVYQTAKFMFLGSLRKSSSTRELTGVDIDHEDEADIESIHIRSEEAEAVRVLIAELKMPRDRELLMRYYVYDEPKPAICDALGLSVEHFDRVLHRARSRFADLARSRNLVH